MVIRHATPASYHGKRPSIWAGSAGFRSKYGRFLRCSICYTYFTARPIDGHRVDLHHGRDRAVAVSSGRASIISLSEREHARADGPLGDGQSGAHVRGRHLTASQAAMAHATIFPEAKIGRPKKGLDPKPFDGDKSLLWQARLVHKWAPEFEAKIIAGYEFLEPAYKLAPRRCGRRRHPARRDASRKLGPTPQRAPAGPSARGFAGEAESGGRPAPAASFSLSFKRKSC